MPISAANESSKPEIDAGSPRRILGLREAVSLIVGIVIGAGIFKTPAIVASITGDVWWMFGAWLLGGVVSLIGALCYAELATAYPHAGGDYHFLNRAFGRSVAFLFGWARLSVITTGSIALLSFVFGDYMNHVLPLDFFGQGSGAITYAIAAILLLSWLNRLNVRTGMTTQTWLTALQAGSLLLIVGTAAILLNAGAGSAMPVSVAAENLSASTPTAAAFGLAMVFVLLTYGGWNEAAYISAEIREGRHSMVKALALSIFVITALYMLVTWAYWKGLGLKGMAESKAIAADMMHLVFGPAVEKVISLMVAVSVLTSINGTMIVGARTSYAMGCDWTVLRRLGVWDKERDTPANAIWVQCLASLFLVVMGAWIGGGFKSMVEFTAPVFWLFFLLTGISLFVLRRREPATPRPFRVPLYPLLPLLFCATCAYMLWSSLSYVYDQSLGGINAAWIGVAVLAVGVMLLMLVHSVRPKNGHIEVCSSVSEGASMRSLKRPWSVFAILFAASLAVCVFVVVSAKAQFGLDEFMGPKLDAGFIATYPEVVDGMLQIAGINENDVVYDLGCGDGRIVIAAAKQYGAKGVGVDLNPKRITEAIVNAKAAGVEDRVRFELGNFFEVDFSDATVVMLYLPAELNLKLRPYIWKQLKVGARVVSHDNGMGPDWPAEKSMPVGNKGVFMWTITEEQKKAVANLDLSAKP
ncbi:amino acid permease [Oxalobacter sp. OttesenSCG-928-P03]|nr:amino acid permease [Oxalobacter sp. OttesenSCG-928-P03]